MKRGGEYFGRGRGEVYNLISGSWGLLLCVCVLLCFYFFFN